MISGSEVKLHIQSSPERPEEMGNKFHAAVGGDVAWDTMLGEDVNNEELCKLLGHDGIIGWDEE